MNASAGTARLVAIVVAASLLASAVGTARAQPVRHVLLPDRSHLYVVTGRAGVLGFLGHEHAILAGDWTAEICYDPEDPPASTARIVVATVGLEIDSDRGAELAGLSSRPSATTIPDLQQRMLGPAYLDAGAYPEIRYETRMVRRTDDGKLELEGPFTLHGVTRTIRATASVARLDDGSVRFEASATLRMSGYGIAPENTLGLVDVADDFELVIRIEARSQHVPCR